MKTCMYLRKSRSDEEADRTNTTDTLTRHKQTLLKVAQEKNLTILKVYEEIASGDSIAKRSQMQQLLEDVKAKLYEAVLVMDIDRLGRGTMQEQGLILDTFKLSKTLIVTPQKTYDLNNEFDEQYSEFAAFMARKELKLITQRMQRGREKSIEEGNFISPHPPLGYKIVNSGKSRFLEIDEERSPVINFIFKSYAQGKGGTKIAAELNAMGYKTQTNKPFYHHSIINIIKNPVYIGKVTWKKKEYTNSQVKLRAKEDWLVHEGKHEGIIDEELFNQCARILATRTHAPYNTHLSNPWAGIILCSACNKPLVRKTYTHNPNAYLRCVNELCHENKGTILALVEEAILEKLKLVLDEYEINAKFEKKSEDIHSLALINIEKEISKVLIQKERLHELLEQNVYDIDTFYQRAEKIIHQLDILEQQRANVLDKIKKNNLEIYELALDALSIFYATDNIVHKNSILKLLIQSVIYSKPTRNAEFELLINFRF